MEEDIVWTTSAMLVPLWCTRLGAAAGAEEEEEEEEESSESACMEERSEWRWSLSCWLDLQRECETRHAERECETRQGMWACGRRYCGELLLLRWE